MTETESINKEEKASDTTKLSTDEIYTQMKDYRFPESSAGKVGIEIFSMDSLAKKGVRLKLVFRSDGYVEIYETTSPDKHCVMRDATWVLVAKYIHIDAWYDYFQADASCVDQQDLVKNCPSGPYIPRSDVADKSMYWKNRKGEIHVCNEEAACFAFREAVRLKRAAYERGILPEDDRKVRAYTDKLIARKTQLYTEKIDPARFNTFAWYNNFESYLLYHHTEFSEDGKDGKWIGPDEKSSFYVLGEEYMMKQKQALDTIHKIAKTGDYYHFTHTRPGTKIKAWKVGEYTMSNGKVIDTLHWQFMDENGKEHLCDDTHDDIEGYPYEMIRTEIEAEWKIKNPIVEREKIYTEKIREYIQKKTEKERKKATATHATKMIMCPQCEKSFEIVEAPLPQRVKCPHCGATGTRIAEE